MSEQNLHNLHCLEDLSTETLENFLRASAENPNSTDSDMEVTLHIMEVLEQRAKENGTQVDVDQAWNTFKNDYLPLVGEEPLYSFQESTIEPQEKAVQSQRVSKIPTVIRRIAATAAVLVLIFVATTLTAYACGFDIWDAFATWTADTFRFNVVGTEPKAPDNITAQHRVELASTLCEYGIEDLLAPTWFPEGYQLDSIDVDQSPFEMVFGASYLGADNNIYVYIHNLSEASTSLFEKDDVPVIKYNLHGNDFYIAENDGLYQAFWFTGVNECSISGCQSLEDIVHMIESIYEG